MRVVDLHCDLTSYVALGHGRADQLEVRCSGPQLHAGGVCLQVMAFFTETHPGSTLFFQKQVDTFCNLPTLYPEYFKRQHTLSVPSHAASTAILAAIENASGLVLEHEPLELAFRRLEECMTLCHPLLYLSLTWNTENRFGGGNRTNVGLKEDGKRLLEYLSGKGVAIDLSHTSDLLAHDILNHIDKKGLRLTPIASHSNFRAVCDNVRNLPDEIAEQIVKRGGVIGLNFCRPFLGEPVMTQLLKHALYAKSKGWIKHLCFGADFFFDDQIATVIASNRPYFVPPLDDAACYVSVLREFASHFMQGELKNIAFANIAAYFQSLETSSHVSGR